jgi:hypothetical protein
MKNPSNSKTLAFSLVSIIFMFFILNSCSFPSDTETIDNQFNYKNKTYKLSYGVVEDYGTNYDITGRYYIIGLQSDEYQYPKDYFKFTIMSTSTSMLKEGVYTFGSSQPGGFWNVEIGTDLVYDYKNNAISGQRLDADSEIKGGEMDITMVNGNFVFDFTFKIASGDTIIPLTGYFTDVLHEDVIYY